MSGRSLDDWLLFQESLHPNRIDLGLDRVQMVWQRLVADDGELICPVIVVGGTNGKGSTIAYIEAIYHEAGYQSVAYTSPHLEKYNERIRITGFDASDEQLIEAFEKIERNRGEITLSYFEFGTLAALSIAQRQQPDVLVLEVGLGGRLDAVNILQHDIAIITNISMDHMEWLGNDIADIAVEKAGIARQGRPLIIGDAGIPQSLFDVAQDVGVEEIQLGRDIIVDQINDGWVYHFGNHEYSDLPCPGITGEHQLKNAAAAICAVNCLESRLPVNGSNIKTAIAGTRLAGRFEKVGELPLIYLDVGHNPAASLSLREMLDSLNIEGQIIALLALQKNREIEPVIQPLVDVIGRWHVADMKNGMGHQAVDLAEAITKVNPGGQVRKHLHIADALDLVLQDASELDCIIVFGSFYTVSEARAALHV